MPKQNMTGREVRFGERHAVRVGLRSEDTVCLQFLSPVREGDFGEDGTTVHPRASAHIKDDTCVTQVALSPEAAYALRDLLNAILP